MTIFCRFSSLDDLSAKDWADSEKVKAAALKAGRFSAFDANTPLQCRQLTALCRDPSIILDKSLRYPWTGIRKRLSPDDFVGEQSA